jgi:hypothetical protein
MEEQYTIEEGRLLMFTEKDSRVITHKFLINPKDKLGQKEIQKYISKGFSLTDPRKIIKMEEPKVEPLPEPVKDEGKAGNPFQCDKCEFIGKNPASLNTHKRFKHKE